MLQQKVRSYIEMMELLYRFQKTFALLEFLFYEQNKSINAHQRFVHAGCEHRLHSHHVGKPRLPNKRPHQGDDGGA